MEYLALSELLGQKVRKVYSGSELMYLYELYKYTEEIMGKRLNFEDIQIVKELRKSDYFSYVYSKGLNFNYEPEENELVDITEISRKFFSSDLSGIVFESQTPDIWVYDYNTDRTANLVLNKYNRSAGYVSLYAYMVVSAYFNNEKIPKLCLRNSSPKQEELEYVDVLVLQNFGNCLLKNKIEIQYSKDVVTQPEWEAYVMFHRQLGYMSSEIKPIDKYKYFLKNFVVGDIVLYYKTEKSIKSKTIRRLINCYPAVIREINKFGIKIEYYPDITTALTRRRELQKAEEICGGEYRYSHEDYTRFSSCSLTLDYYNIGVDLLLYLEDEFLLTPQNGVDTFEQYLVDKNGIEGLYHLDTLNNIYAVFEDRHIAYNKESFKNKFFKKEKPIYDKVMGL